VNRANPLKSLSVKLGLVLFVVVGVAMAITYLAVVPRLESRLVSVTVKDLRQATSPLVETVRAASSDRDTLGNVVGFASTQLNARVVVFAQLGGTWIPVADSTPLSSEDVEADAIVGEVARTSARAEGRVLRAGQEFAEVAVPISNQAILLLSAPLADRLAVIDVVRRDVLIFGGIALAVSWLVGTLAALKLTRRIGRLEVAAERIAGGDFDVVVRDSSEDELGQLARTFDRMRSRLSSLDRARREFVANASHELRTPLFALGGFLELLTDEDLDEGTRRDFLETARGQVDRLTRLATDLLDLSRLDAGQLAIEPEPVELGGTADALVEEFRAVADASGHVLQLTAEDGVVALADEARVLQIGRSLVENGLRHTPSGTTVTVGVAAGAARAVLTVHDDGPGITPEDQERVFERFYRGAGGAAFGSGIGLAVARELAVLMDGSIELESRPGNTTFRLLLPRATSPAPFSRENALTRS
jgi:signal transduction histidine kinase